MKRLLLILICVFALPVLASHIVGGEFELVHISGNRYRINLIQYFDEKNGLEGAKDDVITVTIFRKRDNARMMTVTLPKVSEELVQYTNQKCSEGGDLITTKIIYSALVELPGSRFFDAQGYYMSWQRCCRNYSITNIFSENPQRQPNNFAGQTFYLEFPAVVRNGLPFIDSTPTLFPPLSDYACPDRPYYVNFAGFDADGDSLVYSLVTPLNTKTGEPSPAASPRPYPEVKYRPGFSLVRSVGGSPDLTISSEGFLRVTPRVAGLFVFAVKCEEFRDGVKIGEVRRDFQMKVLTSCPNAEPPQITGRKLTDADFIYQDNMSISFSNLVTNQDRCIQVRISDPDASKKDEDFEEAIRLEAVPIGFRADLSGILPQVSKDTLRNGSTKTFDICFDRCPPNPSGIFQVGIVVFDDACALPLSDTLKITVYIEPPVNHGPEFTSLPVNDLVNEGDPRSYPINAIDADDDPLVVSVITDTPFEPVGLDLELLQQSPGVYNAKLNWDTRCNVYDFTKKTNFNIQFIVEDRDLCNFPRQDTVQMNLTVKLPGNADPVISTDLSPEEVASGVTRRIYESLEFNVIGKDTVDDDYLQLVGAGVGFDKSVYNISFPSQSGKSKLSSHFSWRINCEQVNLRLRDEFVFEFIVKDEANKCRFKKADTLRVKVNVLPPENERPKLTIINTNPELTFDNYSQTIVLGQRFSLDLSATDVNINPIDRVGIELFAVEGITEASGYDFIPVSAFGNVQTSFSWLPDCSIFKNGVYTNNYTFRFRAFDNRCFNVEADTIDVHFEIQDVKGGDAEFIPPNFISPNGDGFNDFFAMVRENDTGELESILPLDNCVGRFVSISIYNRWGVEIFMSRDRNFRWYPLNEASGVYFYTLNYSNREYKGTITLRD